jgi:hypothetical protein
LPARTRAAMTAAPSFQRWLLSPFPFPRDLR